MAISLAMEKDQEMVCYGLGATDPKGVFGSTLGLEDKFGSKRVFDMPTSENAMTGISIGLALNGIRSVVTHQRLDFFLLAMDQLVNGAAKYHYMYGSQLSVPITIRLILGRGWGQGPTHSQNLQSWFAHIPGLKVVMPTFAQDAKRLLLASIFDPNPVLFLEHRWLHNTLGSVNNNFETMRLGKAKKISSGKDITIISMSYMTIEAITALKILKDNFNIGAELIDLKTIKPLDFQAISSSVKKTGSLLVLDTGFEFCSVASEIISIITTKYFKYLKRAPARIAMPDVPEPTSPWLTKGFHANADKIVIEALKVLGIKNKKKKFLKEISPHDVPGEWFKGPF